MLLNSRTRLLFGSSPRRLSSVANNVFPANSQSADRAEDGVGRGMLTPGVVALATPFTPPESVSKRRLSNHRTRGLSRQVNRLGAGHTCKQAGPQRYEDKGFLHSR